MSNFLSNELDDSVKFGTFNIYCPCSREDITTNITINLNNCHKKPNLNTKYEPYRKTKLKGSLYDHV